MPVRVGRVGDEIDIGGKDSKMKQFGLRALKWPLTSKEVDKTLLAIERHKATFSLALNTDQTCVISELEDACLSSN